MPSLPRIRSRRATPGVPVVETRPGPSELRAGGVTWVNLLSPTAGEAQLLANRFGWHPLDVEDVLSRRQRPKIDVYPGDEDGTGGYLFGVLHFPVCDKSVGRLNAGELDDFLGPDYLVTLPSVELRPVSLLFRRAEESEEFREQLLARGSGRSTASRCRAYSSGRSASGSAAPRRSRSSGTCCSRAARAGCCTSCSTTSTTTAFRSSTTWASFSSSSTRRSGLAKARRSSSA